MRHSELTTDLHYAKLRTFTGSPANITPNFIDQILCATDTNKVYRATGINQGALIELAPQSQGGGGGGGSSNILVGDSPTVASNPSEGAGFFDFWERVFYVGYGGRWVPSTNNLRLNWAISNNSPASNSDLALKLLREGNDLLTIDFNSESLATDINTQIFRNGLGDYALSLEYVGIDYDPALFSLTSSKDFLSGDPQGDQSFYINNSVIFWNYAPANIVTLNISVAINYSG
ncbi:MAG: hypothetical protein NW214_04125 [Pseudanabaenaceae cyanobacterium bins.39]|nr:hypothetical protein [Pseudanabaenaceae cyanobacterium bins.39]